MLETDEHITTNYVTVYNTTTLQGLLKITDENLTMESFTNQDPFSPPTDNIPNGQDSFEETYLHALNDSSKYDSVTNDSMTYQYSTSLFQETSTVDHNLFEDNGTLEAIPDTNRNSLLKDIVEGTDEDLTTDSLIDKFSVSLLKNNVTNRRELSEEIFDNVTTNSITDRDNTVSQELQKQQEDHLFIDSKTDHQPNSLFHPFQTTTEIFLVKVKSSRLLRISQMIQE